nr:hemolysin family protein [Spirochaeta cellobiosiphila]
MSQLFKAKKDDEEASSLELYEQDMIRGITELSERTVKEVLVPRIDSIFLDIEMDIDELLHKVVECGHSRMPVFRSTIDNVIGILYVKDLLHHIIKKKTNTDELCIDKIMRKVYFVPESKRLDSLLREFQKKRVHIAVAVDEYGGVSGIVSMEDIIEEIVGDIQDEFDNEEEDIVAIEKDVYLCDARVSLEDLNEALHLDLPLSEVDTLGGFVFEQMGKIPSRFEKVNYKNVNFIIQNVVGHKIKTIKIELTGDNEENLE